MGSMYWQTQNNWPGASWASIDYDGRAQVSWYQAKHFYKPFIISGYLDGPLLQVYSINDLVDGTVSSGDLVLYAYSWSKGLLGKAHYEFTVSAANASRVLSLPLSQVWKATSCPSSLECVLVMEAYNNTGAQKLLLDQNYFFPASLREVTTMRDPEITIGQVTSTSDGDFVVSLQFYNTAAFVWIETTVHGIWEENAMFLPAGRPSTLHVKSLAFRPFQATGLSPEQFANTLSVTSLYDTAPSKYGP